MSRYKIGLMLTIACLISYVAGVQVGKQGFGIALYRTQGELAFNHLERYEALKTDVKLNCNESALQKLDSSIREQKMVLAEIINTFQANSVRDYIASRNEELLTELSSYEGNWNGVIIGTECQNNRGN